MHHQRIVLAAAALVLGMLSLGCATSYMVTSPHTLQPCAWGKSGDPKITSMGALVLALQDNRWDIVQGNAERGFVRARACRHTYCISVDAFVGPDGTVELFRSPEQYLGRNGRQLLENWMHKLTRRYDKYRCDPPANHVGLVKGLTMPSESVPPKP